LLFLLVVFADGESIGCEIGGGVGVGEGEDNGIERNETGENGDETNGGGGGGDDDGRGNSKISTIFEYALLLFRPPPKNILFWEDVDASE
jgi:hypothetical protein